MMRAKLCLKALLILGVAVTVVVPQAGAIKLDDAAIFIEINDTDGDAGIQLFLDGEGWDTMQVKDPNGNVVLNIAGENSIGQQGVTELFFESAEPSFDVQSLDELLALFPEGNYRFKGTTTEGKRLKGKAKLTHSLPAGPMLLSPQQEEFFDDVVVEWRSVSDPPGSRIINYEVIVSDEESDLKVFQVNLPRSANRVRVAPEALSPNGEYKVEVLAKERSGNQTITEREFQTRN